MTDIGIAILVFTAVVVLAGITGSLFLRSSHLAHRSEDYQDLEPAFRQAQYDYLEITRNAPRWRLDTSVQPGDLIKEQESEYSASLLGLTISDLYASTHAQMSLLKDQPHLVSDTAAVRTEIFITVLTRICRRALHSQADQS